LVVSSCGAPRGPYVGVQINLGPKNAPISALSNDLGDWARAHRLAVEELGQLVSQADHIKEKSLSAGCAANYQCVYDSMASWCSAMQAQQRWVQGVPTPPSPQASNLWNGAELSASAGHNKCVLAFNDGLAADDVMYRQSVFSELSSDERTLASFFSLAKIDDKALPRPSASVCISGSCIPTG
jgi:hypothetical protein